MTYTPNVNMMRNQGVTIVRGSYPRFVRNELAQAVKAGNLGHFKKQGLLPEVYFHPDKINEAQTERASAFLDAIERISKVAV